MIRRTTTALAAVAATVALMLTGCGADDSDCQGDPGKVSAKDYDAAYTTGKGTHKTHHSAEYELTIIKADGTTYEKDVSSEAYDNWYKVGSKFPHPTKCSDGKVK
jgi:hypothetical protein